MPGEPELSVVICSRNGAHTLPETLAHLECQTLDRSRYELIVIDDGSTDRTAEIARGHGATVVSPAPRRGLAAARNAGVRAATAPTIAFTDDDCRPDRDWLMALASALSDPAVDGASGPVLPLCASGFLLRYLRAHNPLTPLGAELLSSNSLRYRLELYLRGLGRHDLGAPAGAALYSVVGANMVLRRDLIVGLGGFDEVFAFGVEEEELCLRAQARPQRAVFRYEPRAVVAHQFRPRLSDPLRRAHAYGRGHARAALKHADLRLIVYPFPFLTATAFTLAALRPRRRHAALAFLAPLAAYAGWPKTAWRNKSFEPLAYPNIQLAEENATTESGQATKVALAVRLLAANRRKLGLAAFYYYTWIANESAGASVDQFNFAGLLRFLDGRGTFAKPALATFTRAALAIEGCRGKGSLATSCIR